MKLAVWVHLFLMCDILASAPDWVGLEAGCQAGQLGNECLVVLAALYHSLCSQQSCSQDVGWGGCVRAHIYIWAAAIRCS